MKRALSILFLGVVLSGATISCGNNTRKDPLEKYKELKGDVAPYEKQNREQAYDTCPVWIEGPTTMSVVEGKSVEQEFIVRGKVDPKAETILLENAPENLTVAKGNSTNNGQSFKIKYSPAAGTIPGNRNSKAVDVRMLPKSQSNSFVQCNSSLGLVVTRAEEVPVIQSIDRPKTVDYDTTTTIPLHVVVKVGNLKNAESLKIRVGYDETANVNENPIYDLSKVIHEKPEARKNGAGLYEFYFEINPEQIRTILLKEAVRQNPKKTVFEVLAQLTAINGDAKYKSPSENINIKIIRNLPNPPVAGGKK